MTFLADYLKRFVDLIIGNASCLKSFRFQMLRVSDFFTLIHFFLPESQVTQKMFFYLGFLVGMMKLSIFIHQFWSVSVDTISHQFHYLCYSPYGC